MSASKGSYADLLRELAAMMVAVAGESVTMVKRSAPTAALTLKPKQEWDIYLDFLKVLFNLADRLSVLHLPIQEQPLFMDSLEDQVSQHLSTILAPAMGPDSDDMEIKVTIGKAVADSRQRYERFRFLVTDESQGRADYLKAVGERIAELIGATGNGMVTSAATLCISSAIPAMQALFDGVLSGKVANATAPHQTQQAGVSSAQPIQPEGRPKAEPAGAAREIKLVSVMSTVSGEEVETRWGLHPRFRQDLTQDESKELTKLMNRITQILGERYAAVAFSPDWTSWNRIGHA
ncbi:MAG: hypothetical protein ACKOCD_01975 [Nitrospiraceae bacterium]